MNNNTNTPKAAKLNKGYPVPGQQLHGTARSTIIISDGTDMNPGGLAPGELMSRAKTNLDGTPRASTKRKHRELSYVNGKLSHISRAEYLDMTDGAVAQIDIAVDVDPQYASYANTQTTCRPSQTWRSTSDEQLDEWGAGKFSRAYRFRDATTRKPITRSQFLVLVRAAQIDSIGSTSQGSGKATEQLRIDPAPRQRDTEPRSPVMRKPQRPTGPPQGHSGI